MVQAWVAHFVTPLKCTYDKYDWRVTSQKPIKKHKSRNKHDHHGGEAARPSSGVDLMNQCCLRGERPCAFFSNMGVDMRPFFNKLRASLKTFPNFVRCQRLIARNVAELSSSNRGVSHLHKTCCIDELSKGFVLGYEILPNNS